MQGIDDARQIKAISLPHFALVFVDVLPFSGPSLGISICGHKGIATPICTWFDGMTAVTALLWLSSPMTIHPADMKSNIPTVLSKTSLVNGE
jgi:hypothetical protein